MTEMDDRTLDALARAEYLEVQLGALEVGYRALKRDAKQYKADHPCTHTGRCQSALEIDELGAFADRASDR